MTTFDTSDGLVAPNRKPGVLISLYEGMQRSFRRRARRRALLSLSGYDAHLLRDMGIDPGDVTDALNRRSMSLLFYPIRPNDGR